MNTWQPIKTAPRDRFVLLYIPGGMYDVGPITLGSYWPPDPERDDNGRFRKGGFAPADWRGWLGTDGDTTPSWCEPTHWMPLPKPPRLNKS